MAIQCQPDPAPSPADVAGKGGNASLSVMTVHHNKIIAKSTTWLKYNATELEKDTLKYDEKLKADAETVIFTNLKKGNYFLYSQGYDNAIKDTVFGGLQFKISEEKPYAITVYVTEGD